LALGAIAHQSVLAALGQARARFPFAHGALHELPRGLLLADSYHCSRLNTNTGKLTPEMFERVFAALRERLRAAAEAGSAALAHQPRLVALPVARLLGLALVRLLLALGEAELALGDAALVEIERERHQRHALPADGADHAAQLLLVDEELALAARLVVEARRRLVLGDVGVDEPELAALFGRIGLVDAGVARAQHLHL